MAVLGKKTPNKNDWPMLLKEYIFPFSPYRTSVNLHSSPERHFLYRKNTLNFPSEKQFDRGINSLPDRTWSYYMFLPLVPCVTWKKTGQIKFQLWEGFSHLLGKPSSLCDVLCLLKRDAALNGFVFSLPKIFLQLQKLLMLIISGNSKQQLRPLWACMHIASQWFGMASVQYS